MVSNDLRAPVARPAAALAGALMLALLAGCSVTGSRESPINKVTRGSPTVLDVYRGQTHADQQSERESEPRQLLREQSRTRAIAGGDDMTRRYWSALEPLKQRFARVPNPDLVMVVYPHLAKGKYPVPGYVTVFPMYEQTQYGMPGEVAEDLIEGRSLYQGDRQGEDAKATPSNVRGVRTAGRDMPEAGN